MSGNFSVFIGKSGYQRQIENIVKNFAVGRKIQDDRVLQCGLHGLLLR